MDIKYESNDIINKCINILSKPPIRVTKDSHSTGYLKNRNRIDDVKAIKLNNSIDDESYYNELLNET